MKGKQSLESWIVEVMTDEDMPGGRIAAISLVHVVGEHSSEKEIHSVRFGSKVWKETELAELFKHKASSYCQDIPGSQLFCLHAYYGEYKDPGASHPFRVAASTDLGLSTEPPTDTGVRQQGMRLTEALVQGAFRERALLMDNVLRSNELLARHNQRLLEEQQSMTENVRALILQQVTQNHELKMQELEQLRKNELVSKGTELLPIMLNSLTGKSIIPQETVDTALMKTIVRNLKPEHVQAIASVLPAEIMGPLADRLSQIAEEQERKEKEGKQRLKLVSGEEDAVGGKSD